MKISDGEDCQKNVRRTVNSVEPLWRLPPSESKTLVERQHFPKKTAERSFPPKSYRAQPTERSLQSAYPSLRDTLGASRSTFLRSWLEIAFSMSVLFFWTSSGLWATQPLASPRQSHQRTEQLVFNPSTPYLGYFSLSTWRDSGGPFSSTGFRNTNRSENPITCSAFVRPTATFQRLVFQLDPQHSKVKDQTPTSSLKSKTVL